MPSQTMNLTQIIRFVDEFEISRFYGMVTNVALFR